VKKRSLQTKFATVLFLSIFAVCSISLFTASYVSNATNHARYVDLCKTVSETASAFINTNSLEGYFSGDDKIGYIETSTRISDLRASIPDIQAIMVYETSAEGIRTLVDTTSEEILGGLGNTKRYEQGWEEYKDSLLAGDTIEDADILSKSGRMLVYCNPIAASQDGNVYVCVGVLKSLIQDQNKAFLLGNMKVIGFVGLILYLLILVYVRKKIVLPVKKIRDYLAIATSDSDNKDLLLSDTSDLAINNELENIYTSFYKIYTSRVRLATAISKAKKESVDTIISLIKRMDNYTAAHLDNSLQYIILIVNKMREMDRYKNLISDKEYEDLILAAPLHDIGKLAIPEHIIGKPGKFNDEEYEIAKKHAKLGSKIIEDLYYKNPCEEYLVLARDIALYHHERWDGGGYPCGLKGEDIPLTVRIVSVADVFDALVSKRVYKQAFSFEESFNTILSERGRFFDPEIVDIVAGLKDEMYEIFFRSTKNRQEEESK